MVKTQQTLLVFFSQDAAFTKAINVLLRDRKFMGIQVYSHGHSEKFACRQLEPLREKRCSLIVIAFFIIRNYIYPESLIINTIAGFWSKLGKSSRSVVGRL